jgi:hypothetical protein
MADPYKNNVVLYLPMEGSRHGDTVISDRTGKTVTRNGDVILSTTVAPIFGTTSAYFDGNGDYLNVSASSDFKFSNLNFTIEGWFYFTDVSALSVGRRLVCIVNDSSGTIEIALVLTTAAKFQGIIYHTSAYQVNITSTTTITTGRWYHLVFERKDSTHNIYLNGTIEGSASVSHTLPDTNLQFVSGYTLNGTSPGWFAGYNKDIRITKGIARYNGNFSPSQTTTVADDYWANVVLAVHGEGTGTTFTDVSNTARTITTVGNTVHSTGVTPPFGTSSIYFDGTGDYLTAPSSEDWTFGTSDFTIEFWCYPTADGKRVLGRRYYVSGVNGGWTLYITSDGGNGVWGFVASDGTSVTCNINSGPKVILNTWTHIAVVMRSGYANLAVNGVFYTPAQYTGAGFVNTGTALNIGFDDSTGGGSGGQPLIGYLKDIRITKGVARYTQNFNPWGVQDPYYKYSSLLVSGEGSGATFTDSSPSIKAVTANGNVAHSTTIEPPFGSSSIYFDGSGDYLSIAISSDLGLGTGDFVLEAWVYPISVASDRCIIDLRQSTPDALGQGTFFIDSSTGGKLAFWDGVTKYGSSGTAITTSSWTHVTCVRKLGMLYFLRNGIIDATISMTTDLGSSRPCGIGGSARTGDLGSSPFYGYMKDIRIIKGVAKYTANFTPVKIPAQTKSNGAPIAFADKTAITTIAKSYDWDSPEPVRIML